MADTYTIKIGSTADTAGINRARTDLDKLTGSADKFIESMKLGVGIDLGGRVVQSLADIPNILQSAIERGVAFNAQLEGVESAVAAVMQRFNGLEEPEALNAAADAVKELKAAAADSPATIRELSDSWLATTGVMTGAGISTSKQIDLVVRLSQAVARLNLPTQQLTQETRALVTGNINLDAALAKTLGVKNEDVRLATEQGRLYEFLTDKIGALGVASDTYAVRASNLEDAIDQLLGTITEPVFQEFRKALLDLREELNDAKLADNLRSIGIEVGELVKGGAGLLRWALLNAEALAGLAGAVKGFVIALAAVKLAQIVGGLGLKTAALLTGTTALNAETAALARNTAAQVANGAARGKGGIGAVAGLAGAASVGVGLGLAANVGISAAAASLDQRAAREDAVGARLKEQLETLQKQTLEATTQKESEEAFLAVMKFHQELQRDLHQGSKEEYEVRASTLEVVSSMALKFDQLAGRDAERVIAARAVAAAAQEEAAAKAAAAAQQKAAADAAIAANQAAYEALPQLSADVDAALLDPKLQAERASDEAFAAREAVRKRYGLGSDATDEQLREKAQANTDPVERKASLDLLRKMVEARKQEAEYFAEVNRAAGELYTKEKEAADALAAKQESRQQREEEVAILRAEVAGNDALAESLKRQRDIRQETARIIEQEYGADATEAQRAEAARRAEELVGLRGSAADASAARGNQAAPGIQRHYDAAGRDVTSQYASAQASGSLSPTTRATDFGQALAPRLAPLVQATGDAGAGAGGTGQTAAKESADTFRKVGEAASSMIEKVDSALGGLESKLNGVGEKWGSRIQKIEQRLDSMERA